MAKRDPSKKFVTLASDVRVVSEGGPVGDVPTWDGNSIHHASRQSRLWGRPRRERTIVTAIQVPVKKKHQRARDLHVERHGWQGFHVE